MLSPLGRYILLFSGMAPLTLAAGFFQLLFGGEYWLHCVVMAFAMIVAFGLMIRHGARNLQFQYLDAVIVKSLPTLVARLLGYNLYCFETAGEDDGPCLLMTRLRFQMDVIRQLRVVRLTYSLYLHVKEPHE